uniref:Protein kinase domain-containing protein n=1 Tax=Boechera divaricarpa TaxID=115915 RepID=B2BXT7_9BRAS|nr:putative protein kinase-1 [Boechera divaricarpa]
MGQAFHGFPISFLNPNSSNLVSFSTSFVFAIIQGPAATGHDLSFPGISSTHRVQGWSFNIEGKASDFDITKLPSLPDPPRPLSPRRKEILLPDDFKCNRWLQQIFRRRKLRTFLQRSASTCGDNRSRKETRSYLVYEYNRSLDLFLFSNERSLLNWSDRFKIIKGIATALQYLQGECQRTLIHGNVKSSNVLLDEELHARLGDYGQGNRQSNTGHVAAELVETAAAQTRDTDVFAFDVLIELIEIVCARKAIEPTRPPEEISLVNWVLQGFRKNKLLECCDVRINQEELVAREVLLILKLGLLCINQSPQVRPVMRKGKWCSILMVLNHSLMMTISSMESNKKTI